jgi:hypothetical protein
VEPGFQLVYLDTKLAHVEPYLVQIPAGCWFLEIPVRKIVKLAVYSGAVMLTHGIVHYYTILRKFVLFGCILCVKMHNYLEVKRMLAYPDKIGRVFSRF